MACCKNCANGDKCASELDDRPIPVHELYQVDGGAGEMVPEGEPYFVASETGSNGQSIRLLDATVQLQVQDRALSRLRDLKLV